MIDFLKNSNKKYLVSCDLETTSLDVFSGDWITGSFGILDIKTLETIDELEIQSRPNYWNHEAYKIHLIREDKAMTFPDRKESIKKLSKFLPKKDFIFLCHANPNQMGSFYHFDYAMLKMDFVLNSSIFDFWKIFDDEFVISTVTFAKEMGIKKRKLNELAKKYNIELNHHNAKSDRIAMEKIFKELIEYERSFSSLI